MFARGFALAALASLIGLSPARAQLQDVIMAMPSISLSYAMVYIAADKGLFEKNGLNVKLIVITGVGATNAVIAGSADFSTGSGASLTRAVAKGQKLLAIAGVLDRTSIDIVLRKSIAEAEHFDPKASLADRVKVLRGHTLAIAGVNSVDQVYLNLMARRAGFDPDEIHIAIMATDNSMAAFASNQIDGLSISPPMPQKLVMDGSAVTIASGFDGDPPDMTPVATTIIMAKPETCEKRAALCMSVGQSMKEAAAILHDHTDEASAVVAKRMPAIDATLIATMVGKVREAMPYPPVVTVVSLQNADRMNVEAGLLKKEEMLGSYDDLTTDRFVR